MLSYPIRFGNRMFMRHAEMMNSTQLDEIEKDGV